MIQISRGEKGGRNLRGLPFFSGAVIACFIIIGVFGGYLAPHNPTRVNYANTLLPPVFMDGGKSAFPLGTDELGRDILSRLLAGTGISLQVAFVSVVIAGMAGTIVALLSGYLRGFTDTFLMRLTDTMLSMPYLMVSIVLAAVLGPSKNNIILIFAFMGWSYYARVLRSEVLRLREKEFVALAIISGCGKIRIMVEHIFPNIVNPLIILATLQIGFIIIAESSLSFLGVGVPPPDPAWGLMVAEGRNYIASAWWVSAWPGLAILLVVLSCNVFGDWLRVTLDPKFRQI
jgi:peptide/nickel transport system permease protein